MEKLVHPPLDLVSFERHAAGVADLLRALGNQRRLMIMCKLAEHGEMTVNDLANEVGLSQSALSQHLAKMRPGSAISAPCSSFSASLIFQCLVPPWSSPPDSEGLLLYGVIPKYLAIMSNSTPPR